MRVERVLMTPELATKLLSNNSRNRSCNAARVRALAGEMKAGRWEENGETIKVAATKVLLDGQHRLRAVLESGCSLWMLIVWDLDESTFTTIDIGKRRSLADTLARNRVPNYSLVASALCIVKAYLADTITLHGYPRPTNREVVDLYAAHESIQDSTGWAWQLRPVCVNQAVPVAMHYLFAKSGGGDAERFMSDLASGAMLPEKDPVLRLREQLVQDRASRRERMPVGNMIWLFVKAWNLRVEGRSVRFLRVRLDGPRPEQPPRIIGLDEAAE